jgi:2-polyprenyl-3-methyl-5-hydroxy-6-metoxy-1,4-benzoquinol methylase
MSLQSSTKMPESLPITPRLSLRDCPLCGSREFRTVFEPIKRCCSCQLCFVNPLGDFRGENETPEYFLNEYLPVHTASLENSMAERRSHIAAIHSHFKLPARPRLLDVGCATGVMLEEAKAAGWDPVGVETSEFAAKYAAEKTGCPVYAGTLEQAAFPAESFDVVTLMDVIEHVPNPSELIKEIHRVLRPRGVLFIVTPNFGSFFVWLYGPKAYGVWPDQHVVYFQPSTIERLLRHVGFAEIITGTRDFYGDNLRRLLRRKKANAGLQIKAAFGVNGPVGHLRHLANQLLMHVPLGDKLIAFGQKPAGLSSRIGRRF